MNPCPEALARPNALFSPLPPVQNSTITAADLARRYDLTLVKAHRWLRELPHWNVGRTRFTSEPMLAGWLAANVKNPPRVETFDPLQDAVVNQAIELIQRLAKEGRIAVLPTRNPQPTAYEFVA